MYQDDYGHGPKEVYRSRLAPEEVMGLSELLATLPIRQLADLYEDSAVDDGIQVEFSFDLPEKGIKKVKLVNRCQEDLFKLVGELNSLLPDGYGIALPCHSADRPAQTDAHAPTDESVVP